MPLTLHPALSTDLPSLLHIYFTSFTNPLALVAFPPSSPSVRKWWSDMLAEEIQDPNALFIKIVDSDLPDGQQIIAWAKWNRPVDREEGEGEEKLPTWPEDGDGELAERFFKELAGVKRILFRGRGVWYLELLATLPEHQGRGAGSMLLKAGLEQADEQGIEAYLEASPVSVGLYTKAGFEKVGTVTEDVRGYGPYTNVCMLRKAKEQSED